MDNTEIIASCNNILKSLNKMQLYTDIKRKDIDSIIMNVNLPKIRDLQFLKTIFNIYLFLNTQYNNKENFSQALNKDNQQGKFLITLLRKETVAKDSKPIKTTYKKCPFLGPYLSSCYINSMHFHGLTYKNCLDEYNYIKKLFTDKDYSKDFLENCVASFILDDHLFIEELRNFILWNVVDYCSDESQLILFCFEMFIKALPKLEINRQQALLDLSEISKEDLGKLIIFRILSPLIQIWNYSPGFAGTGYLKNWNPNEKIVIDVKLLDILIEEIMKKNAPPPVSFLKEQNIFKFYTQLDYDIYENYEISNESILQEATELLYAQPSSGGDIEIKQIPNIETNETLKIRYIALKERADSFGVSILKLIPGIVESDNFYEATEKANEVTLSYLKMAYNDIENTYNHAIRTIGHMSEDKITTGTFESAEIINSSIASAKKNVESILYYSYSDVDFKGIAHTEVTTCIKDILYNILISSSKQVFMLLCSQLKKEKDIEKRKRKIEQLLIEGYENRNMVELIINFDKGIFNVISNNYNNGFKIMQMYVNLIRKALELVALDKIEVPDGILKPIEEPTDIIIKEAEKLSGVVNRIKTGAHALNTQGCYGQSAITISDLLTKTDAIFSYFQQGALQGAILMAQQNGGSVDEVISKLQKIISVVSTFKDSGFYLDGIMDFRNSGLFE